MNWKMAYHRQQMLLGLLCLLMAALSACGGGGSETANINVSGTWRVSDLTIHEIKTMTLQQDGNSLSGAIPAGARSLTVTGTIDGTDIEMHFSRTGFSSYSAGKVNSPGTFMEGTYQNSFGQNGIWNATKQ